MEIAIVVLVELVALVALLAALVLLVQRLMDRTIATWQTRWTLVSILTVIAIVVQLEPAALLAPVLLALPTMDRMIVT
jgi:uncharacterized membrane protein YhaH (DUF805 family)